MVGAGLAGRMLEKIGEVWYNGVARMEKNAPATRQPINREETALVDTVSVFVFLC